MLSKITTLTIIIFLFYSTCFAVSSKQIFHKAQDFYKQGNYDAAEKSFKLLLDKKYRYRKACLYLGNIKTKKQKWRKARTFYTEALAYTNAKKNKAIVTNYIADTYIGEFQWVNAIEALKKSLISSDKNSSTYFRLGFAYESIGLSDNAIQSYKKAHAFNQNNAYLWFILGQFYEQDYDLDKAKIYYEKAALAHPHNTFIQYRLAYVLHKTGKSKKAYEIMSALIQKSIHPDYLTFLGDLLYANGEYEQAEHAYRRAILLNKQDASPYIGILWAYLKLDKQQKVVRTLEVMKKHNIASDDVYYFLVLYMTQSMGIKNTSHLLPKKQPQMRSFWKQMTNKIRKKE